MTNIRFTKRADTQEGTMGEFLQGKRKITAENFL